MQTALYKLATKTVIAFVLLLIVFSPYQTLIAQAQSQTPSTSSGNDIGCSVLSGGGFAICLTNVVYVFTVGIGSGFTYAAAYFFDIAIQLSLNSAAYALDFISSGWTTARDLANMAFLFILLYIAFTILLQADTSNTMSLLAGVVVVALLVNFSFFFTRVAIDAGNILSIQFYNSINAPTLADSAAGAGITNSSTGSVAASIRTSLAGAANTKDLTASIMGMLQLQNLFNTSSFQSFFNGNSSTGQPAAGFMVTAIALTFLYIGAGVMFWILTIMFVTVGVKFLARIVVLWFLIIASPLAFVARALPQFKKYFDQWLSLLISHSFYPVAFMFIFLILVNLTSQMSCTTATGATNTGCAGLINGIFNGLSQASNTNSAVASIGFALANVAIRLGLVIAVLYVGLRASSAVSVMGASFANKAGGWAGGKFPQLSSSIAGFAGRQTIGRASTSIAQSSTVKLGGTRSGVVGGLWRGAGKVSTRIGSATFDPRNAPGASLVRVAADKITAPLSAKTGKAPSDGYMQEAKAKAAEEKNARNERAAILREQANEKRAEIRDEANKKALERIVENVKTGTPEIPADVDRVKKMNKKEIEGLKSSEIESIAHLVNENQLKIIQDSEKYTDDEKEKIQVIADPNIKSQKIIVDELRKLNRNLINLVSDKVRDNTAPGARVNGTAVVEMRTDIRNKLNDIQNKLNDPTTPPGDADDHKVNKKLLLDANTSLNDLGNQLAKVPAQGAKPAGEVIAS